MLSRLAPLYRGSTSSTGINLILKYTNLYHVMYMHIIYIQIETGNTINSPVEIKLSGDGAPFHRSTSYILLSFSFPSLDAKSLSGTGK